MPGIGVLYNPRSGRHLRDPRAAGRLIRTLGDHGIVREAASLDQLYRAAEDFRRFDVELVAISGGDGTNGVTITGLLEVYAEAPLPRIALLRGGTMNTIANAVGVRRGQPTELLARLIRAYTARTNKPLRDTTRHVVRLSGERALPVSFGNKSLPPMPEKCGFLFGTGVVHGFLAEYYRGGRPSPKVAAETLARGVASALVGGRTIQRMANPFRGSVTLADGTLWEERDYLAIAGGTIDQIGLHFRPFWRCSERQDAFHVLGIHASPMAFVRELPNVLRKKPIDPACTYDAVTSRIVIRSNDGPIAYMVDGDLHACEGPLTVAIGPKIRLVVGT